MNGWILIGLILWGLLLILLIVLSMLKAASDEDERMEQDAYEYISRNKRETDV